MDPGVHDTVGALNLPTDTIQVTLGETSLTADQDLISNQLPQSQECLKRCGLLSRPTKYDYK